MLTDNFQIVGQIKHIEVIAVRHSIRILDFLKQTYVRGVGASSKVLLQCCLKMVGCV